MHGGSPDVVAGKLRWEPRRRGRGLPQRLVKGGDLDTEIPKLVEVAFGWLEQPRYRDDGADRGEPCHLDKFGFTKSLKPKPHLSVTAIGVARTLLEHDGTGASAEHDGKSW